MRSSIGLRAPQDDPARGDRHDLPGAPLVTKKTFSLLLGLLVVISGLGAGAAYAYTPESGARFNDPGGSREAVNRSMAHIRKSIESAKKGSIIRIATYTHNRADITDALIDACKQRHVTVQMVLNDNNTSRTTRRLIRVLGSNIKPHYKDACNPRKKPLVDAVGDEPYPDPSYVKICYQSCRKGAGNQHMKFYLFSKAGSADDVVMVGSANTTGYGARTQWNDMFTATEEPALRDLYTKIFEQLVRNRQVAEPYVRRTAGVYENEFFPHYDTTAENDPVMERLNGVRCAASGGTGSRGHTVIRIVMYGWGADRGLYLAQKVADLDKSGCDVKALLSAPGRKIVGTLQRGGVLVKSADLDLDNNDATGFDDTPYEVFTHQKYMALSGSYRGAMGYQVWTGSENWSGMGMINDEVVIRIPKRSAYEKYVANFDYVWSNYSRWYA